MNELFVIFIKYCIIILGEKIILRHEKYVIKISYIYVIIIKRENGNLKIITIGEKNLLQKSFNML